MVFSVAAQDADLVSEQCSITKHRYHSSPIVHDADITFLLRV